MRVALAWRRLESLTGISRQSLRVQATVADSRYRSRKLTSANGKTRDLDVPLSDLRALQVRLVAVLKPLFRPPDQMHGFIRGRSPLTAGKPHCRRQTVLGVDIRDCYPTINYHSVWRALVFRLGVASNLAEVLARVFTVRGRLPQGSPSSPFISNVVLAGVCDDIGDICRVLSLEFSMYADDIQASGDKAAAKHALPRILRALRKYGFEAKREKIKFQNAGSRQRILGLNVDRWKPKVGNWAKRAIVKQAMEARGEQSAGEKPSTQSLLGKIAWIRSVSPRQARSLRRLAESLRVAGSAARPNH